MIQVEIILLAVIVATACVLPGVFLILRGVALMSDAISHAILLGIVVTFFIVKDLHSPLILLGAVASGVLTVSLTELLINTKRLKKDAAIGLVFPVFFSIGVILIAKYAKNIHLDVDAVLLGEIAYAPLYRLNIQGIDLGPRSLWTMGAILLLNIGLVATFYKELKLATFDRGLAKSLGFTPLLIHYGLMTMTSVTAVGAFDAVGSILVVALMITPPATAYLLTTRLSQMLGLSIAFGILSAIGGYGLATALNASISGAMASMTGLFFILVLLLSPNRGILAKYLRRQQQKIDFGAKLLTVQLLDHEGTASEITENTISNMIDHMKWTPKFAQSVTRQALQNGFITRQRNYLQLTNLGRETARSAMSQT